MGATSGRLVWMLAPVVAASLTACGLTADKPDNRGSSAADLAAIASEEPPAPVRSDLPVRSVVRAHCTRRRPCYFVRRLEAATSPRRFTNRITPQRFSTHRPLAVMAWADGRPVPARAIGLLESCGLRFVLNGRVVGWANLCGRGRRHMHFQFTNVSQRPVQLVVGWHGG